MGLDLDSLEGVLSPKLLDAARRLQQHVFKDPEVSNANRPQTLPLRRLAAVLMLLYERDGMIRVLLTTRSQELRSHPGQVALPGGRSDPEDETPIETALREANEEVGLPRGCPHVHVLRTLPPVLSLWGIIVTPVVALLSDLSVISTLVPNKGEVDDIFDHPLEAILDPSIMLNEPNLSPRGPKWVYPEELYNWSDNILPQGHIYRNNRFRSTSTAVKGLTSSMLLVAAEVMFARKPTFDHLAPRSMSMRDAIQDIIKEEAARQAQELEIN